MPLVEIRNIYFPFAYFILAAIYYIMGEYVEPKILSFYADRNLIAKKYAQPIISLLFLSFAVSLYLTISTKLFSLILFQKNLLTSEVLTSFVIYYFIFVVIGYLLALRKRRIIKFDTRKIFNK